MKTEREEQLENVVFSMVKGMQFVSGFLVLSIVVMYMLEMYWVRYVVEICLFIFLIGISIIRNKMEKKRTADKYAQEEKKE